MISGQAKTTGLCQSLSMQLSSWWALFTEITFVFVVLSAMQLSFSEISFPAKFIQLCDDRLLPGHDHGLAAEYCSSSICYWYSLFPRSLWAPSYNWMEIEAAVLISSTIIVLLISTAAYYNCSTWALALLVGTIEIECTIRHWPPSLSPRSDIVVS